MNKYRPENRPASEPPPVPQIPDPWDRIRIFFERNDLGECRASLWKLLSAAIASEDADNWDRQERGNLVFFCGSLDEVLRALFQLQDPAGKSEPAEKG